LLHDALREVVNALEGGGERGPSRRALSLRLRPLLRTNGEAGYGFLAETSEK
jgi:hypothetical protein